MYYNWRASEASETPSIATYREKCLGRMYVKTTMRMLTILREAEEWTRVHLYACTSNNFTFARPLMGTIFLVILLVILCTRLSSSYLLIVCTIIILLVVLCTIFYSLYLLYFTSYSMYYNYFTCIMYYILLIISTIFYFL